MRPIEEIIDRILKIEEPGLFNEYKIKKSATNVVRLIIKEPGSLRYTKLEKFKKRLVKYIKIQEIYIETASLRNTREAVLNIFYKDGPVEETEIIDQFV